MGGLVALTIRFSDATEWRGSCHTNALPLGLLDAPFYIKDTSEQHTKAWLAAILQHRKDDPELEEMWGGHNMLAPDSYGLVLVDYKADAVLSMQNYTHITRTYYLPCDPVDDARTVKWRKLDRAGKLKNTTKRTSIDFDADIEMPFTTVICGENEVYVQMKEWVEANFVLSDAEKAAWSRFATDHTMVL